MRGARCGGEMRGVCCKTAGGLLLARWRTRNAAALKFGVRIAEGQHPMKRHLQVTHALHGSSDGPIKKLRLGRSANTQRQLQQCSPNTGFALRADDSQGTAL